MQAYQVPIEQLRRVCDPQSLPCTTTEELPNQKTIIGQARAARSLRLGLGIQALGFNIYVAGLPGTGKMTMVRHFLEQVAHDAPTPDDWCYVNNFRDAARPRAIRLPIGRARQFQADMKTLIEGVQREMRKAFESEEYAARRKATASTFEKQGQEILARINAKAQEEGFALQQTPMGVMSIPLRRGHPLTEEQFMSLSQEEKAEISERQRLLQEEIDAAIRQGRNMERQATEKLAEMDQQVALYVLSHLLDELKEKYQGLNEIISYLDEVQGDILENLEQFRGEPQEQSASPYLAPLLRQQLMRRYAINVLVDHTDEQGAPVVTELNPTYTNLFGRIENEAQLGTLVTDFTLIRQGALHRANGGYLVVPIEEVLRNPFSWDSLKRALRSRQIMIEDAGDRMGFMTTRTLQPQPIALDLKVILIGRPDLYYLLEAYDEDFKELFKVKADFDSQTDRSPESARDYALFVNELCATENLKHLDNAALAKLVEHGSRLVGDQMKLSTRFGELADVVREASFYATQEQAPYVTTPHIRRAIEEKVYRSNLLQERLQDMTKRGTLLIDVQGEQVGQVNGLSVLELDDFAFGQPTRITANIGVGREGVVDIEREAKLGGPTHTKGVMILAGYLLEKYAQDKPLSLAARLVFEQSYSGVEGDSASSTELYAILSALAGLPIKQGIAVTGSVNQKGAVQAIGGVNEKIEGFFATCQAKGLTGEQGVLIPASNVQNLMLKEEVVAAVAAEQFHIWAVQTIDEGIAVLTGVPAGERQSDGRFAEGSVNALVDKRLQALAAVLVRFGKEEEGTEGGGQKTGVREQKTEGRSQGSEDRGR